MKPSQNILFKYVHESISNKTPQSPHNPSYQAMPSYQPHDIKGSWRCVWQESPNSWQSVVANWGARVSIGDNFYFSSGDAVNPMTSNLQGAVYVEPGAELTIGNNVGMSSTCIWVHDSVAVGDNVKIGACVLITDTDAHPMDYMARRTSNEGTKSAPIVIEDDVWVGAHCIILKGVTIGARSIIGAGSVVTKSIPADCVAAGNPCRVIKNLK